MVVAKIDLVLDLFEGLNFFVQGSRYTAAMPAGAPLNWHRGAPPNTSSRPTKATFVLIELAAVASTSEVYQRSLSVIKSCFLIMYFRYLDDPF